MAEALSSARILSLEEHCRRRVDRQLAELVDQAFYDHVERALELWQHLRRGRPDAS